MNLYALGLTYGVSDRFNVQITLPYSAGSGGVHQGTAASHRLYKQRTEGIGDLSFEGEYWLTDPHRSSRLTGSVALGLKTPTGSTRETGRAFSASGDVDRNIDEAFQLGDGGWGLILRGQGTAQLGGPWFGYSSGYYMVSLDERYSAIQGGAFRGVPDAFSGRLGVAYQLPAQQSVVLSVGGIVNGVPVRDLVGGGDLYWRRPGYQVYVEPGVSWSRGTGTFFVSYPLRAYQKKQDSLLDQSVGRRMGADFAASLIKASYSRRF